MTRLRSGLGIASSSVNEDVNDEDVAVDGSGGGDIFGLCAGGSSNMLLAVDVGAARFLDRTGCEDWIWVNGGGGGSEFGFCG
tara:strand:+ start:1089 stop:1334 length:246 start_codon:yes stop_codon:yes gene_type:complete